MSLEIHYEFGKCGKGVVPMDTYKSTTMNADDIARELGVSKSLVYGLMKTKDFPALRIGAKRIVCYRTEFEKWLHQQKSKK